MLIIDKYINMVINCKVNRVYDWNATSKRAEIVSTDEKINFSNQLTVTAKDQKTLYEAIAPGAVIKITVAVG